MNQLTTQALNLLNSGQVYQARQLPLELIEQDPRNPEAWTLISLCTQDPEQKKQYLDQAQKFSASKHKTPADVLPAQDSGRSGREHAGAGGPDPRKSRTRVRGGIGFIALALIGAAVIVAFGLPQMGRLFAGSKCPPYIREKLSSAEIAGYNVLEITGKMWEDRRACYRRDIVCEGGTWELISLRGKSACTIVYAVNVNGKTEVIPMFYADLKTNRIYTDEDLRNFDAPSFLFKYLEDGYLEVSSPVD